MSQDPVISIVEDDKSAREGTRDLIEAMSFVAETFGCAEDFLHSHMLDSTSCLIADIHLPGMTGLELHAHLVASGKVIPTVLITAYPDLKDRERALQAGVFGYLTKPLNESELRVCIQSALDFWNTDMRGA